MPLAENNDRKIITEFTPDDKRPAGIVTLHVCGGEVVRVFTLCLKLDCESNSQAFHDHRGNDGSNSAVMLHTVVKRQLTQSNLTLMDRESVCLSSSFSDFPAARTQPLIPCWPSWAPTV